MCSSDLITIDIFFYQPDGDKLVTGVNHDFGYMQEFEFSRFDLQKIDFLETGFYAPDDIDKNLAENFGDWRIPDRNYISHLESPSTRKVGGDVYMIVARTSLLSALIAKNFEKAARAFKIAVRHADGPCRLGAELLQQLDESCGFAASQQVAVEASDRQAAIHVVFGLADDEAAQPFLEPGGLGDDHRHRRGADDQRADEADDL